MTDLLHGTTLRQRAREAIGDRHLHDVLRTATDLFTGLRHTGVAGVSNFEELREAARQIRGSILAALPAILEQLADNVEQGGGKVCWARTSDNANAYISEVAQRTATKLVVKSKSMASEEIHLNAALESQGIEVVETDLGEWIIQLAGQTPSHIIAPAIHLSRGDVAAIFNRISGGDLSDVPSELCAYARAQLREKFLTADMGISGVNFGIAETGSMLLVTNEGNGRMVTSLPKTHIAVMGMERVVRNWTELDVLLALLPRSASGQQISSYVTIVTGPRRPGEVDGPDEFHLVILDNGRSDVCGTELQEILHCIRCGACLNVCPVYRQIGGHAYGWVYSGPVGAVLTPLLNRAPEAEELSGASSLCAACHHACPVMIPLQDLLLTLRRKKALEVRGSERRAWRAWARLWSRPSSYRASTKTAAFGSKIMPEPLAPKGWREGRTIPRSRGKSFRARFERGEI